VRAAEHVRDADIDDEDVENEISRFILGELVQAGSTRPLRKVAGATTKGAAAKSKFKVKAIPEPEPAESESSDDDEDEDEAESESDDDDDESDDE
jgi:hypothetical protein